MKNINMFVKLENKMEEKKYELTDEILEWPGHILHRIKALKDFSHVKKGDLGGWIENEDNLSQEDNCWVYSNAKVFDKAYICHNAEISGRAVVCDYAIVCDNAEISDYAKICGDVIVCGDAEIFGNAVIQSFDDYEVFQNKWSSGRCFTWTKSNNMWKVGCFYDTGKELIKKAYKDNEESGRKYKAYVNLVKKLNTPKESLIKRFIGLFKNK